FFFFSSSSVFLAALSASFFFFASSSALLLSSSFSFASSARRRFSSSFFFLSASSSFFLVATASSSVLALTSASSREGFLDSSTSLFFLLTTLFFLGVDSLSSSTAFFRSSANIDNSKITQLPRAYTQPVVIASSLFIFESEFSCFKQRNRTKGTQDTDSCIRNTPLTRTEKDTQHEETPIHRRLGSIGRMDDECESLLTLTGMDE
ncbi:hypothetical protein PMAYCL1PPCAC_28830, partial [Pristionchus mayeri]